MGHQNSDKPAQEWKFIRQSDGSYKIVNQKDGASADLTNIQTYTFNASSAQLFRLTAIQ